MTPAIISPTRSRAAGYTSAPVGEQHLSIDPSDNGYDGAVDLPGNLVRGRRSGGRGAARDNRSRSSFVLASSRPIASFPPADDAIVLPPAGLPMSRIFAAMWPPFKPSARALDAGVGAALAMRDGSRRS